MIVGRVFRGVGINLAEAGLEVKKELLESGEYSGFADDFLSGLGSEFTAVENGNGQLLFGIEPAFSWEKYRGPIPKTEQKAKERIAKALGGKVIKEDGFEPTEKEILALVDNLEENWIENW